MCEEFGVNYILAVEKVLYIKSLAKYRQIYNVNIAISGAVNSYARIHIGKLKLDLMGKGYTLY
jgi:hypothetical protein